MDDASVYKRLVGWGAWGALTVRSGCLSSQCIASNCTNHLMIFPSFKSECKGFLAIIQLARNAVSKSSCSSSAALGGRFGFYSAMPELLLRPPYSFQKQGPSCHAHAGIDLRTYTHTHTYTHIHTNTHTQLYTNTNMLAACELYALQTLLVCTQRFFRQLYDVRTSATPFLCALQTLLVRTQRFFRQ